MTAEDRKPGSTTSAEIVAGAVVREGRILLGCRAAHKRAFPLFWDLIGGHVEFGETSEEALRREFVEELGIEIRSFEFVGAFSVGDGPGIEARLAVYRIDAWQGEIAIANDEHTELRWFGRADLAEAEPFPSDQYRSMFDRLLR